MISVAMRFGISRAEGYPVTLPNFEPFQFFVYHGDRRGDVDERRWVVSEASTGRRVTVNCYPTDTLAIQAAQSVLNADWSHRKLWKAIRVHMRQMDG